MNFGLVGPNGAGKSTLLQKIVEMDNSILPFSFSNLPISNCGKKGNLLSIKSNRSLVADRIEDLESKWGPFYKRNLFSGETRIVMDEIFLTKLLRIAPTNPDKAELFIDQFQECMKIIFNIETKYIDCYIFVRPSLEQWTSNILHRPTKATSEKDSYNRFRIQILCLEAYLSILSKSSYITIGNFERNELKLLLEFIKNSNS